MYLIVLYNWIMNTSSYFVQCRIHFHTSQISVKFLEIVNDFCKYLLTN